MSSFFKFKKKKIFLNISSPTLLQWSSQIPGRRGWTTPSSKQQTFLTYEAAQWRNGGLRKARALLPTSEFSWPDHVDLNLCAGGEQSGCFNAVKSDQPLPSKEDTGGTPLEPRPCSTTCFRMKGKMEFAGTAFIIGTGEISTQIRSWNFPQLFCFQPISHLAQMPGLKPKEWNLSCLRLRSLFRHTRP